MQPRPSQLNRLLAVALGVSALVVGFAMLCIYNPMHSLFLSSFAVRNNGHEPIRVAVLGVDAMGGIGPLYEFRSRALPLPIAPRLVEIQPGQSETFLYDWDDINFCWLAVEASDGSVRLQETALDRTGCSMTGERGPCCGSNRDEVYEIGDVQALELAPRAHREAMPKRLP